MPTVAAIYRHPVKSLGEEALSAVELRTGAHMPYDRLWAIAHGQSEWKATQPAWIPRKNFLAQAHVPELAQIRVATDEEAGTVTLSHPAAGEITVDPDEPADAQRLTAWIAPVARARRPGPYRVATLFEGALTDVADAHLAINSTASLGALEEAVGQPLHHGRFRGNIWIDGLEPWAEAGWVGQAVRIGEARLWVSEPIGRCLATAANPETGERDADVVDTLRARWGHHEFGVYARVLSGGRVAVGDAVEPA